MFSFVSKIFRLQNWQAHREMLVDLSKYKSQGVLLKKESNSQELTIFSNDRSLKIIVLVPHGIFEWFIDIYSDDKKILSTWMDHYGSPQNELVAEMRSEIDDFVSTITRNEIQVAPITSIDNKKLSLQYRSDGGWKNFDFVWSQL